MKLVQCPNHRVNKPALRSRAFVHHEGSFPGFASGCRGSPLFRAGPLRKGIVKLGEKRGASTISADRLVQKHTVRTAKSAQVYADSDVYSA